MMASSAFCVSDHLVARVCDDVLAIVTGASASAKAAGARLRLLRAAWSQLDRSLSPADIEALASCLAAPPFLIIDMDSVAPTITFSPSVARIVLNLVLLGVESVGGPGRVALSATSPNEVAVRITGPVAAWPNGTLSVLHDEASADAALGQRGIGQAALTAVLAREAGARLSLLLPASRQSSAVVPPLLLRVGGG